MNFKEFQEDFNKVVRPQIEEILSILKDQQASNVIEAAAAKIITELKLAIHDCPCNKEILDAINVQPGDLQLVRKDDQINGTARHDIQPRRYSYPNSSVGNENLGTGKNPNSLTWPFDNESVS